MGGRVNFGLSHLFARGRAFGFREQGLLIVARGLPYPTALVGGVAFPLAVDASTLWCGKTRVQSVAGGKSIY